MSYGRIWATALGLAVVLWAGVVAARETGVALVFGNTAYRAAPQAAFARQDAQAAAEALRGAGLRVQQVLDADSATMRDALERFAAVIPKGEPSFVYFAGHAVQAPAADRSQGLDNYLLAVDAAPTPAGQTPSAGVSLTAILDRLNRSGAGAQVIVLEAPGIDPFSGKATGLAQPTNFALRNAYLAFAAAPGQVSLPSQRNQVSPFTREFAAGLRTSGASVNQLFQGVSAAVERATGGRQSPFFVGGGASARLVLNSRPAANTPGSPEGDLPIYAEALKCGTEACLRAAAPKLSAGTMKADLESRLASLSKPAASDRPEDFDPTSMDLKFGVRPEYPEAVQRAIREKEATAAGRRALGQAFLTGAGGFPPDDAQAFYYFVSAQNRGDAAASYYVGQFWETGRKPAAQPSPEIALQQYARAANAGHPEAMTAMGRFHEEGKGGARRDLDVAQSWYRRAAEAGSVEAAQALARLKGP